jgi:aspartyl-tRNA(Asn)/glutamyl-tRNA(Gln) amidotransferase subunit C
MSEALPEREVERIARLARLAPTPAERRQLAEELGQILAFAAAVASVDTSGVEPGADWLVQEPLERPDEPRPSLATGAALANAPEQADGLVLVPRVRPRD